MLEQAGHEVRDAGDGEEGLGVLYEKPTDLVIADILMPKMDGLEMVRRMKQDPKMTEMPVMILTAKGAAETRIEGYRLGVDDFLTKPFNREELKLRAGRLLRMRQEKMNMAQKLFELGLKVSVQEELLKVGKGGDFASAYFDLKQMSLDVVRSLALALDARDHYTRGHSEWVAKYSVQIAQAMQCSEQDLEKLELAALLHDVGKIGMPDEILKKPAALTAEEFAVVKEHPGRGADAMQPIKQMGAMIPAIRHHHERLDGKGYPDGLDDGRVPRDAQIICVADAYDAMTSDRPYRQGMSREVAFERLRKDCNTQFAPELVEALIRSLSREKSQEQAVR
jgi:response regulator RpfG family c-di-GMP phosphodiesterase